MPKVIYDHQIFSISIYSGVARYICRLAEEIGKYQDWESSIFCGIHMNKMLLEVDPSLYSGIYFPRIPKVEGKFDTRVKLNEWLTSQWIKRNPPEIFHESVYSSNIKYSPKFKRVMTVYDMIHEKFTEITGKDKNRETIEIIRRKKEKAEQMDHLICISENTRRDLIELTGIPPEKTTVVHLASDMEYHGQPSMFEFPYLLYVGQRQNYKNFMRLLQLYISNERLHNNFKLLCFGAGSFTKEEKELMSNLSSPEEHFIHARGGDDLLSNLYGNAKALVYPSSYEGFGLPLTEAMRTECPIVCSNASCLPEVAGMAAEYFDPFDQDSMMMAIENVVFSGERTQELIEVGKRRASTFTWKKVGEETKEVYSSLLS